MLLDETQSPSTIDVTESVVEAHYFADRENVVMVTDGGNVIEYTDGNAQFADTVDVQWQNGVDVKTYSSRIYVLDPESNQIWKYQRGTSGYGSASAYVSDDTVDLSEALSFSIDGYIWILNEDGSITQLLSGENVPYALRQAPLAAVDGATKLYTELDINQLYLLDPTQSRVLIYNKSTSNEDLTYSSQYVLDGLKGTLQDLYFDKERDVIVMVTDFALYELGF